MALAGHRHALEADMPAFAEVHAHVVPVEVCRLRERPVAQDALEGAFSGVRAHVLPEVARRDAPLPAPLAHVVALPVVCPHVSGEVARLRERPSAQLAGVWALASVRAHVLDEVLASGERAHAERAFQGANISRRRRRQAEGPLVQVGLIECDRLVSSKQRGHVGDRVKEVGMSAPIHGESDCAMPNPAGLGANSGFFIVQL